MGGGWPEFKTLRMQLHVPTASTPKEESGPCKTLARVLEMCANSSGFDAKIKYFINSHETKCTQI